LIICSVQPYYYHSEDHVDSDTENSSDSNNENNSRNEYPDTDSEEDQE